MLRQDIVQLTIVCEDFGIPLPDYVIAAQHLKAAASALYVKVDAETPPTTNGVTAKSLEATFKALLAWPGHDARMAVAAQLSQVADTAESDAWARFSQPLMEQLRAPFDRLAGQFMITYDSGAPQDAAAVATLGELVRVRDQMAGRVGDATPTYSAADLPTRCATLPYLDVLAVQVPARTHALQRGSLEWLNAMLSVEGCRLRWHTPIEQAAHVAGLRHHAAPVKV